MENSKIEELTPEAIQAEKEQLKETPEAEVRESLIEKYGLDELEQSDLIESLVKDRLEDRKKLSTVIGQKITWREKAQSSEQKPEVKPQAQPNSFSREDILKEVEEKMEMKELESLELSDELKTEVKSYAKVNSVSYREALKSPYMQFRKKEADEVLKADEASISSKHKTMAKRDFSEMNIADHDLTTEKGREDYEEHKQWLRSQ